MSTAAPFKTFLGHRVYQAPFLKLYFPFFLSGATIYFLFAFAHTKMMDRNLFSSTHLADPQDKWLNIVDNVKKATAQQKLKNEALEYMDKHPQGAHH